MPRRRIRKTDRKPLEQRRLRVRGIRLSSPDPKKLSRAFIELALARAEADAQAQVEKARRDPGDSDHGDGEADDGSG